MQEVKNNTNGLLKAGLAVDLKKVTTEHEIADHLTVGAKQVDFIGSGFKRKGAAEFLQIISKLN